jgi:hypothetical protein
MYLFIKILIKTMYYLIKKKSSKMTVFFSLVVSKTIPSNGPHALDTKYTMKLNLTMEVNWGAIL